MRLAERSRIVLFAAEGKRDIDIAAALSITLAKAARWRKRFLLNGLAGLEKDAPRLGRTPAIGKEAVAEIVRRTTKDKPLSATHWSTPSMAAAAGVSDSSILRIWRTHGLKPYRIDSFKLNKDPDFSDMLEAIVGLYLAPPDQAIVLCMDETRQVQALDRSPPGLPIKPVRAGTTTLFASLNSASGKVISLCRQRHRHQEWIKFLRLIDDATPPEKELHFIAENDAAHTHPKVGRWLKRHSRFHVHYTPTSSSWLNRVERFFLDLTENRLRRGVFRSILEWINALDEYVHQHNANSKPFIWTAKANDILAKVVRA